VWAHVNLRRPLKPSTAAARRGPGRRPS